MATNVRFDSSQKRSRFGGIKAGVSVASADGRMEKEVLDADILLPSVLPFKKIQTSVKYPDGHSNKKPWKHLKQIIKAENYDSYPAGEPNYVNIQSTPSSYPAKTYCDITGFATSYKDPRTKLRYANTEMFKRVRSLSDKDVESYLALRKAAVVLK